MNDLDLPSLQSIQLGQWTLDGVLSESCSLVMRSMNKMTRNEKM